MSKFAPIIDLALIGGLSTRSPSENEHQPAQAQAPVTAQAQAPVTAQTNPG